MSTIPQQLASEFSLRLAQVDAALELLAEGATVPFIARYRKERTGEMTEVQLRGLAERHSYLTELADRKATILTAIADQGKLTDDLRQKIDACLQKTELEDLYLPFRPKRRTRAAIAKERGLEPLADWLRSLNRPNVSISALEPEAAQYVNADKGVNSAVIALQGASDILAEAVAEKAELRAYVREYLMRSGVLESHMKSNHPEGSTKFEMYRQYRVPIKEIAPHNLLAILRGETEGVLAVELTFSEDEVLQYLALQEIKTKQPIVRSFYQAMLQDAFQRLMKSSLINAVMTDKKAWADEESIKTFEENLRHLLLASPAGMKPTLGVDPGFRTGCKVAALGSTGQFLEYRPIFPHQSDHQRQQASQILREMITRHQIALIAIGNGTAGRETDAFVTEVLQSIDLKPIKVMVSEAGASVYSASEVALREFPDLDITVRGAISIARRLQDPLAELVKIDPKSIGVGQYQHDVNQKRLKQKLDETVESCVNYVGVDLNTASRELLTFVSGITPTIASNIVAYRTEHGAFQNRQQILKVAKLGAKAFEQAAGFLRIRNGTHPLDNTAVHPESYAVVTAIAQDLQVPLTQAPEIAARLHQANLNRYVTDTIGEPTLRDIIRELEKPGRDPRAEFTYATFQEGINDLKDLRVGMELEGVVTNVANFGAFVDIGVHQDGLVHISQLADRFISDPKQVVKVGQVVKVRVLEVNAQLNRISLSMRSGEPTAKPSSSGSRKPNPQASLADLKAKFNRR